MRVYETELAAVQAALEPIGQWILQGTASSHLLANDICRPWCCEQPPPAPALEEHRMSSGLPRITPVEER